MSILNPYTYIVTQKNFNRKLCASTSIPFPAKKGPLAMSFLGGGPPKPQDMNESLGGSGRESSDVYTWGKGGQQ